MCTGIVGRPPGQKPTINRRPEHIDREETVDIRTCPKGHALSENVTDSYDRVVKVKRVIVENVKYRVVVHPVSGQNLPLGMHSPMG